MRALLICAFVVVCVSVLAERCRDLADCSLTVCPSNSSHIACHEERCTCDAHVSCTDMLDCMGIGRCHDHDEHYHCLDARCECLKDHDLPGEHHGPGGPHPHD
ncbi:serine protease inhibitor Cvsi-2-like [Saccostrea cucullata]|uniref:serine protease inhibitor Cvsi-2-like n=1 Tax=Saccostrea cuccullata TaxID=36930 RepID=UPI002ED3A8F3